MKSTLSALVFALVPALAFAGGAAAQAAAQETVYEARDGVSFDDWRADYRARTIASGRDAAVVDAVLDGLEPDMRVIELDRDQPEFVRPVWEYLDSAVSETRVETGAERAAETADTLAALEERYAIDRFYLVALWGLESNFGGYIGDFDAARSLATLAWEGRRRGLFESELTAMIDIIASGAADRNDFVSGWAGALGQTQFMPSVYLRYAVDQDGDGKKDVWANRADALASAALYIADNGWRQGESWGAEVRLPEDFDYAFADGRLRTVGAWAVDGVTREDGQPWAGPEQFRPARLLLPAGAQGPAFLTFHNFDVFKRYNNSTSYALAAGLLGDAVAGKPRLAGTWPRDERPLTRDEVMELQRLLNGLGYATNGVDGLVGPNTRAALRAFQADRGLAADAFPTASLLERARTDSATP